MISVSLRRIGPGRVVSLAAVLAVPLLSAGARPDDACRPDGGAANSCEVWDLPFFFDLHTFRGAGGATTVVAAVAVPVRGLRRERYAGSYRYRFDVRFVLADTARQSVVERIDSVFVTLPGLLGRDHLLHTVLEVEAIPSDHAIQRLVVTDASRPGIGQMYDGDFEIPDYAGDALMISDVAFGLPEAAGGWTRGDHSLALLPTSQFPQSAFDIYYEVYNLPAGRPYDTEITVEPIDGSDMDGRRVQAAFSEQSMANDEAVATELRRLESTLPRGRYRLTLSVRDRVTSQVATQTRDFDVRGWGRGATLVPALSKTRGS